MNELESNLQLHKRLAPLRVISAALILGVIAFACVAFAVGPINPNPVPAGAGTPGGQPALDTTTLMRLVWAVVFVGQVPLVYIVRNAMINRAAVIQRSDSSMIRQADHRTPGDEQSLHLPTFDLFRNANIISLAMLEGAAMLGAITVMFSAQAIDLSLVALPVAGMAALFPTVNRWRGFHRAAQERSAVMR